MNAHAIKERDLAAIAVPPAASRRPASGGTRIHRQGVRYADDVAESSGTALPFSVARTILPRAEGDGDARPLVVRGRARYQPIRPLGAGGMGEVTLAYDRDIGRQVAVKRLPSGFDDATAGRFVEEIRTVGQLEHPNIVPIYDAGLDDEGRYFFVMKYVEGESLAFVIERLRAGDPEYHRRYTIERRVSIFLDVLRALSAAHLRGVLHRDIKPGNVMVGRAGEVMVIDWGIAKVAHGAAPVRDLPAPGEGEPSEQPAEPGTSRPACPQAPATQAGALVGTPSYMSPEQAGGRNKELDERSDLYSATVLFHELVTLRHYLGDRPSSVALLVAVITDPVSFQELAADRHPEQPAPPAELLHFVVRGLQKEPDERFQSAGEMIQTLESLLEARRASERLVASAKRVWRGLGRLCGAHLQLVLVILGVIVWRLRHAFS